ncbi:hypothetical protein SCARD494_00220 [Seiridium cardinale]
MANSINTTGLSSSFAFKPAYGDNEEPNWDTILQQPVQAVWFIHRSGATHDEAARGFNIAVQATKGRIVTLHPTTDTNSSKIKVIARPLCTEEKHRNKADFPTLVACEMRHARATNADISIGGLLGTMHKSGITNYALKQGRGIRFWFALALVAVAQHTKAFRNYDRLHDLAIDIMRNSLPHSVGCHTDVYKLRKLTIGFPAMHLLSKQGVQYVQETKARIEVATERQEGEERLVEEANASV